MREQTWALIAAGGRGLRAGGEEPKQFWSLGGKPILVWATEAFERCPEIDGVVLVAPGDLVLRTEKIVQDAGLRKVHRVVVGGQTRAESVKNGLDALPGSCTLVVVHDAARPFVQPASITRVIQAAARMGAALLASPVTDTLKRVGPEGQVLATVPREGLFGAQTPQAFRRVLLARAFAQAGEAGFEATDEASLLEGLGQPVAIVAGDRRNLKLTEPEDRELAAALAAGWAAAPEAVLNPGFEIDGLRVGQGFDVHRLDPGRPLVLGGVTFENHPGLLGHSDADVLTHAAADAVLGALGAGDLGEHFPDTDPKYAGVCSLDLLATVGRLVVEQGARLLQLDVTLLAQSPKLAPKRAAIRRNLAQALCVTEDRVSIKASTTEGLGFVGRQEGLAALATALVVRATGTGRA